MQTINVWGYERGFPTSGHSPVACSYEHSTEFYGSIIGGGFLGLDAAVYSGTGGKYLHVSLHPAPHAV